MAREGREIRARVGDPDSHRWPIVEDLRAEGVTDYIALPIKFIDGSAHTTSWTTKQEGGFTDEQVAALRSIIAPLSRLVEVVGLRRVATTCSTPTWATVPVKKSSAARSGAATPRT